MLRGGGDLLGQCSVGDMAATTPPTDNGMPLASNGPQDPTTASGQLQEGLSPQQQQPPPQYTSPYHEDFHNSNHQHLLQTGSYVNGDNFNQHTQQQGHGQLLQQQSQAPSSCYLQEQPSCGGPYAPQEQQQPPLHQHAKKEEEEEDEEDEEEEEEEGEEEEEEKGEEGQNLGMSLQPNPSHPYTHPSRIQQQVNCQATSPENTSHQFPTGGMPKYATLQSLQIPAYTSPTYPDHTKDSPGSLVPNMVATAQGTLRPYGVPGGPDPSSGGLGGSPPPDYINIQPNMASEGPYGGSPSDYMPHPQVSSVTTISHLVI